MLTVSNYHYIREDFSTPYPSIFGVTPDAFEKQLRQLKNHGDFIHPSDLLNDIDSCLSNKANYFLVTFDDGLKEQCRYALPILDALNIPAVFFANSVNREMGKVSTVHKIHLLRSILSPQVFMEKLSTAALILSEAEKTKAQHIYRYDDKAAAELKFLLNFKMDFHTQERVIKSIFDDYFSEAEVLDTLYMTEAQYIELARNGFLGSHTHAHYPLGLLNETAVRFELEHSKSYFEKLTDTKIHMVSYPYGTDDACTDAVAKTAENVGYRIGFMTKRGENTGKENLLLLNRFDCNDLPGGKNYK